MSGFHILPPSWTSGATASANSQANASVAASNLLFVQPSRKWQSLALGTLRVTLDAGSSKSWDTVSLLRHNGFNGTLQIMATDTLANLFTTPSYTSSTFPLRFPGDLTPFLEYDTWTYHSSVRTHRYIGLQIIDSSNPAGFFRAGVVMVGVKFMPGLGPELGARSGRDDPSMAIRLLNGEAVVRPKRGIDVGTFMFPMQSPTEVIRWRQIHRIYGSKIPMTYKWDPIPITQQTEQYTFYYGYAKWRSGGPITYTNGHGMSDVEMAIEEV